EGLLFESLEQAAVKSSIDPHAKLRFQIDMVSGSPRKLFARPVVRTGSARSVYHAVQERVLTEDAKKLSDGLAGLVRGTGSPSRRTIEPRAGERRRIQLNSRWIVAFCTGTPTRK